MEDQTPNDILVVGSSYTPYYTDENENYQGTLFTNEQVDSSFAQKLIGLPVYIEHDDRHPIGDVVDSFVNEKNQVKSVLHIQGNPVVNELLPEKLATGYYKGFSLGNDVGIVKENDSVRVVNNVPKEVSIVRTGDRPDTWIDDYFILPKSYTAQEFIQEEIVPAYQRF